MYSHNFQINLAFRAFRFSAIKFLTMKKFGKVLLDIYELLESCIKSALVEDLTFFKDMPNWCLWTRREK